MGRALAILLLAACAPEAIEGTQARMDFSRADGFYAAPFPSDDLLAGGAISLAGFPNPGNVRLVQQGVQIAGEARGFAVSGGVFFAFDAALDPGRLPDLAASVTADAPVFVIGADPASPDFKLRLPVEIAFAADGGPHGAPNLLSILPLQGRPLRPGTLYAAVILRRAQEPLLGVSLTMALLADGEQPAALSGASFEIYQRALAALEEMEIDLEDVAGLAAFTTGDPTAQLAAVRADALSRPLPAPLAPFQAGEVFDEYCVFASTLSMPVYQEGAPPFSGTGGGWVFDAAGRPVVQGSEEANLVVTVPRAAMPSAGYPLVVLSRTGAGGERPLVDRGRHAVAHGEAVLAGSGPALEFARAGFAGLSADGPHGGLRNVTQSDEQFLIFNLGNPAALRDNVRQSALELALLAHVAGALTLDSSSCPGAPAQARFDTGHLALMGHSMGATISPLAVAVEPRFGAAILSGAGASWIENVIHKEKPLAVRPLAEALLGYNGRALTVHDPVLTLVQWAAESADPQVYARRIVREPAPGETARRVLMLQGVVDHYIMFPIANALSLSLGLSLVGPALDVGAFARLAPLVGSAGGVAILSQHAEDGIEDGHEVVFQTEAPKAQYRCFLRNFARAGACPD